MSPGKTRRFCLFLSGFP